MIAKLKECGIATLKQSTEHILDLDEYLIEKEWDVLKSEKDWRSLWELESKSAFLNLWF